MWKKVYVYFSESKNANTNTYEHIFSQLLNKQNSLRTQKKWIIWKRIVSLSKEESSD